MDDRIDVAVGRRLRARRRLLGMTQTALASRCGVTFQQIQKYECAASRVSATMLYRLACALEVEVDYFFAGLEVGAAGGPAKASAATSEIRALTPQGSVAAT